MNPATKEANRSTVRDYLLAAYRIDETTVDAALADPEIQEEIARGESLRSHAYYVGEKVAAGCGWDENPEFDPDADDEEDD